MEREPHPGTLFCFDSLKVDEFLSLSPLRRDERRDDCQVK